MARQRNSRKTATNGAGCASLKQWDRKRWNPSRVAKPRLRRYQPRFLLGDLFDSSWSQMVRLATFLVGSQAAAEDLVSDTFERFAKLRTSPDDPRRYLRTSVVNACRSHHRRLRTERVHRPRPHQIPWTSHWN